MLAAVDQAREDLVEDVGLFLVERQQVIEVARRKLRLGRLGHAEELRVVGRNRAHVFLDAVEDAFFLVVDAREEAGRVVMGLDAGPAACSCMLRVSAISSSSPATSKPPLRRHAGHDADAADGDVGILVREQDGRADALVAAAGRIGAVDAGEHRNARLLQLGVAEEAAPPDRGGRRRTSPARAASRRCS